MLFVPVPLDAALTEPAAEEQYLLELINRDRAAAGAQPLALDLRLGEAADGHSRWMISAARLSHQGLRASTPRQRMDKAGFSFGGRWSTAGENVGWVSQRDWDTPAALVRFLHKELMLSPGHRANLLREDFSQVGLGFVIGQGEDWRRGFVTQDFAGAAAGPFLTGVVYVDRDGGGAYDAGEGLAGVRVTVTASGGRTWSAYTRAAGGYDIALPSGRYAVRFSGPGLIPSDAEVVIQGRNVKLDRAEPAPMPDPQQARGGPAADMAAS